MRNPKRKARDAAQLAEQTGLTVQTVICIQQDLKSGVPVGMAAALWEASVSQVLIIAENTETSAS